MNTLLEDPVLVAVMRLRGEIESLYVSRPDDDASWKPCLDAIEHLNQELRGRPGEDFDEPPVNDWGEAETATQLLDRWHAGTAAFWEVETFIVKLQRRLSIAIANQEKKA